MDQQRLDKIETPEQIQAEIKRVGSYLIRSINGSQQQAFMTYAGMIGKVNDTVVMTDVLAIIWAKFKTSKYYGCNPQQGLHLFLNVDMQIID